MQSGIKRLAGGVDPWMAMGFQLVMGSIPLFTVGEALEPFGSVDWSGSFLALLALLAVFGTALASLLWFRLLERNALSRLNTFTFLTPVVASAMGMLLFGERLNGEQWGGILLMLAAAMLAGQQRPSAAIHRVASDSANTDD